MTLCTPLEEIADLPIEEVVDKVMEDDFLSTLIVYAFLQKEKPGMTVKSTEQWMEAYEPLARSIVKSTMVQVIKAYKEGKIPNDILEGDTNA